MKNLSRISKGISVAIPLVSGKSVTGTVNSSSNDELGQKVVGALPDSNESVFMVREEGDRVTGLICVRSTGKAYKVDGWKSGQIEITEMPLSQAECVGLPAAPAKKASPTPTPSAAAAAAASSVPALSSKPESPYVLYIDMDGETVDGSKGWNRGNTIVADPSKVYTNNNQSEMYAAWEDTAEDFAFLNINVTTDRAVFDKADPRKRVQCVVTPTDTAEPGSGGVAFVGSFGGDSPVCWSFNHADGKTIADTVAHEVGHTLGLGHDGVASNPNDNYYGGHNGWSAIMGVGYGVPIVQWSKGEYADANNHEDDIAKMLAKEGIGSPADDYRGTIDSADNINAPTGKVEQTGIIQGPKDADYFKIPANDGAINITATPSADSPDLKVELTLFNSSGTEIGVSDTSTSTLKASIKKSVNPGSFYLRVRSVGYGDPVTNGYSDYASLGAYTLSGVIPGRSVPVGELQPDLIAGSGKARVGASLTGKTNQKYEVQLGKRKRVKVPLIVSNLGFAEDIFKLKRVGHFAGHKYTVTYKGADVTKAFKDGKFKTKSLEHGQQQKLLLTFKVKRSVRISQTLTIDAVSTIDKSKLDRVSVILTPTK